MIAHRGATKDFASSPGDYFVVKFSLRESRKPPVVFRVSHSASKITGDGEFIVGGEVRASFNHADLQIRSFCKPI